MPIFSPGIFYPDYRGQNSSSSPFLQKEYTLIVMTEVYVFLIESWFSPAFLLHPKVGGGMPEKFLVR